MNIRILDIDARRIAEIDRSINLALREMRIDALVTSNSEPPSLAREGLIGKVPVLEIAGKYWSIPGKRAFTKEECIQLLTKLQQAGVI